MSERFDLAIIGAGSAGLIAADFAVTLGAKIALLENNRIGGDCTWTGCVPSKSLIHVAHVAHDIARASRFGVEAGPPRVEMPRVRARVRDAVASIYAHTTPEELERRGIHVFLGPTAFADAHTITCGGRRITVKHILICTGARAMVPDIVGLSDVPFLTYSTLFDLDVLPASLLVLGGGPLGIEMAQAFQRLGSRVTVLSPTILEREEPEAQSLMRDVLAQEGVEIVLERGERVRSIDGRIELSTPTRSVIGDQLLVAAGRAPVVDSLGLERAGVRHDAHGIHVDKYLRTNVKHIYACGDVIGGAQFSHLAGWQAFQAVRNALLPSRAVGFNDVMPAVTFSDPEVARVGPAESDARARFGDGVESFHWPMRKADRASATERPTASSSW